MTIRVSYEAERGCGYRKVGGLYLISGKIARPCGRIPFELVPCSHCGQGLKQSRSWRWISPGVHMTAEAKQGCEHWQSGGCTDCPLFRPPEKAGLMWVGIRHYPEPRDFLNEAAAMGMSKRIPTLPRGLEQGKTWVFVGHPRALTRYCTHAGEECDHCGGTGWVQTPGIIAAFRVTGVEKVVDESCTEEEAEKLRKRGIEPVIVKRQQLPLEESA